MKRSLLTGAVAVMAAVAHAQFLTGFEAPTYSAGALEGQDGWAKTAGNDASGVVTSATDIATLLDSKGFRSDNATAGGDQALVYAAPATGGATTYYRQQLSGFDTTSIVRVNWSMRSLGPSSNGTGTWMVLDEYNNNASRAAAVRMVRSSDTTHTIDFFSGSWTNTSIDVDYDEWYDFSLIADYNLRTYQLFVNGTDVTNGGVNFYHVSSSVASGISLFRGGPDTGAIFDDISVEAVPEPGTMAALGLLGLAALRRKRKV